MNDELNFKGFLQTNPISMKSCIPGVENIEWEEICSSDFTNIRVDLSDRLMLGKRAERYFSALMEASDEYDLVAENVQVISEKQTIGEFDFFIRRKRDNQLIHIELVYKFYLNDPTIHGSEFEKWIGPNKSDRLDYKLDKLQNHQFPLLRNTQSIEALAPYDMEIASIEQRVLFLANLFVPANGDVKFDKVNKAGVEGIWQTIDNWKLSHKNGDVYSLPDKKDWFKRDLILDTWLTFDEAQSELIAMHSNHRSPMLWKRDAENATSRGFVVWW